MPKLNINSRTNEETKNFSSINNTLLKQNSQNYEKEINDFNIENNNNINNINNSQINIKNEVEFYKKLYTINKKYIKPIKKNRSLDKNNPSNEYYNINNNSNNICVNLKNNLVSNISNKNIKLYKLYEPNTKVNEVKKMPKFKILNNLRNNNNNKYNIYWKNKEDIYKGLYKNNEMKSELVQLLHKDKSLFDTPLINAANYSQNKISIDNKIFSGKNKLSPISVSKNIFFQ